jgi:hypothetical protein
LVSLTTLNRSYCLTYLGDHQALLSGHPQYCRKPTPVRIGGSTWGGSMIEVGFLGEGMNVEFILPDGKTLTTSKVVEIRREPLSSVHAA